MDKIEKVRDAASIKTIAPKLLDAVTVNGKKALLVALDLASELRVKKYWKIDGHVPQAWDEVLVGAKAAQKIAPGHRLNGQLFKVAGKLEPTGSEEDSLIFSNLIHVQKLLHKDNLLSFIELT